MFDNRITISKDIHFGQPCIKSSRIPVYCILELLYTGISFEEIISKYYPDITIEDIKACIRYALDIVKTEEVHFAER